MEKAKRKGNPKQRWIPVSIAVLLISSCARFLYFMFPGHSMSYFSRFHSSEEVVAYLHEQFDLNVTTQEEILVFMNNYPLQADRCSNSSEDRPEFSEYAANYDIENVIVCSIPIWSGIPGTRYYHLRFFIGTDGLLRHISAEWYCTCI